MLSWGVDSSGKGGDFWERKRTCTVPPALTLALPRQLHSRAPGPLSHPSVRMVPWAWGGARGTGRIYGIKGRAGGPDATSGQPWVSALWSVPRFHAQENPQRDKEKQS